MTRLQARQLAVHQAPPVLGATLPPPQGATPGPSPLFEIDLGEMLKGIWRRRWTVIGFATLGVIVGLIVALAKTPIFTSQARLMLDDRHNEVLDTSVVSALQITDEFVETEIEVVLSRDIKTRTAISAELPAILDARARLAEERSVKLRMQRLIAQWVDSNPGGLADLLPQDIHESLIAPLEPAQPARIEDAIKYLNHHLTARQVGNTSVMEIRVSDQDPEFAALVANATAKAYLDFQLEWKTTETSGANDYLIARIDDLRAEIGDKRRAYEELRSRTGSVGQSGGTLLAQRRLLSNERLLDSRNARIKLETTLESIDRVLNSGSPGNVALVINTPVMEELRVDNSLARQRLAELSTTFGERHPIYVDAQSKLAEIQENIQGEALRHVNALRTELTAARREESLLETDLAQQNAADEELDEERTQAEALLREIETSQSLLDEYQTQFKDAREQEAVLRPDARVISEAVPSDYSNFPSRKLILAGSTAVFAFLGTLVAFIRDTADQTLRSVSAAEAALQIPVLGALPALKGRDRRKSPLEYVSRKPASAFNESLRNVVTSLGLRPQIDRGQVLLVSSAVPGEGKSSASAVIAHQVARAGLKSVIIECDLRRPSLAPIVGCDPTQGLIQLLQGKIPKELAVQKSARYGMSFIASGGNNENSLYLLQSEQMRELVDWLKGAFDLIVIDSPPVVALPDAQVLAEHSDCVLYLCRWGSTPRETSAAGVRMLVRQGGAPVMAALSQVDMDRYRSYERGYGDPSLQRYYAN